MIECDFCVIGGGPSGYAAAMRAIDFGQKTVLIERGRLGGAGLFNGALSSKTMWELADYYNQMRSNAFGYEVERYSFSYESLVHQVNQATAERHAQLQQQIEVMQAEQKLIYIKGQASLKSQTEIQVITAEGIEEVKAKFILLATGSRPRQLPHIPIDEYTIVTSDGISNWETFPESVVILGAGVIGCEFATIWANFRRTRVFLIDKQSKILPFEDDDIGAAVSKNLENMGVTIHRESELVSMRVLNGKVVYELKYRDGSTKSFEVEKALIAVGRVPNVEGLGLERAGIALQNGALVTTADCETQVPHIFAIGDLTADIALVNIAELEGRHAVEKAVGVSTAPITYKNISTIMFLNPEVAAVGMNEQMARKAGIAYRVASIQYSCIPRAIAKRVKEGFFKIIVSDDPAMKILGIRAIGPQASSNIQAIALLIHLGLGVDALTEMVHAHPSMPEGVQECVRVLKGTSIMKPNALGNGISCKRVDERGNEYPIFADIF